MLKVWLKTKVHATNHEPQPKWCQGQLHLYTTNIFIADLFSLPLLTNTPFWKWLSRCNHVWIVIETEENKAELNVILQVLWIQALRLLPSVMTTTCCVTLPSVWLCAWHSFLDRAESFLKRTIQLFLSATYSHHEWQDPVRELSNNEHIILVPPFSEGGQGEDLRWPPGTAPFHLAPLEWPLCATAHSGHCDTPCWSGRTKRRCLSPGYSYHIYGTSALLWQAETKTSLEQRLGSYTHTVLSPPSKNKTHHTCSARSRWLQCCIRAMSKSWLMALWASSGRNSV